jgi:hypothetical protein
LNWNIFEVSRSVEANFEKPGILPALIVVLVPALIAAIGYIAGGWNIDWAGFAVQHIVKRFVLFFVLAAMIFAVGMIFNSKNSRGMFSGIVSALGLFYVFAIIIAVISQIAQRLIFTPALMARIQVLSTATVQEIAANTVLFMANLPKEINFPLFFGFLIIGLIICVWQYFVLYKIISFSSKRKPWINIASWAVIVFIYGLASAAI